MNLKILKLVSGEEIVGEVVTSDDNTVTLKNVIGIMVHQTRDGIAYGFMPWGQLVDGDKTISLDKTVYTGTPNSDLQNNYASMFGGIVTPPKQILT